MDVITLRNQIKDKVAQEFGQLNWNELLADLITQSRNNQEPAAKPEGFEVQVFNLLINAALGEYASAYFNQVLMPTIDNDIVELER